MLVNQILINIIDCVVLHFVPVTSHGVASALFSKFVLFYEQHCLYFCQIFVPATSQILGELRVGITLRSRSTSSIARPSNSFLNQRRFRSSSPSRSSRRGGPILARIHTRELTGQLILVEFYTPKFKHGLRIDEMSSSGQSHLHPCMYLTPMASWAVSMTFSFDSVHEQHKAMVKFGHATADERSHEPFASFKTSKRKFTRPSTATTATSISSAACR